MAIFMASYKQFLILGSLLQITSKIGVIFTDYNLLRISSQSGLFMIHEAGKASNLLQFPYI
jgi:hypothetical protein